MFLDPRFQHILSPQQKTDAINHLKSIWDRLYSLNPTGNMCSTPNSSFNQIDNFFYDEEDEMLEAYLSQGVQSKVNSSIDVYTKIENLQLAYQRFDKKSTILTRSYTQLVTFVMLYRQLR